MVAQDNNGNIDETEDDVNKDHKSGSTDPGGEVSPVSTVVVAVSVAVSGSGLVVEAMATQEIR